jgi:hypothetical protein
MSVLLMIAAASLALAFVFGSVGVRSWFKRRYEAAEGVANKAATHAGKIWGTIESEIDDDYNKSMRLAPILQEMPLFWGVSVVLVVMLALDLNFGISRGGSDIGAIILLCLIFSIFDILLFISTLFGSPLNATPDHKEKMYGQTAGRFAFMVVATVISIYVVIGSTSETATTTAARNNANVTGIDELQKTIENKQKLRDRIATRRAQDGNGESREALERIATELEEKAEREAKRGGCGWKCEKIKADAIKARARAEDAAKQEALTSEIAVLTSQLKSTDGLRGRADPVADVGEAIGIPRKVTETWQLTVVGIALVLAFPVLLLLTKADLERRWLARHDKNGRIADFLRKDRARLPPKYITQEDGGQLLLEDKTGEPDGDTFVINMAERDMLSRFKNDEHLATVNALFSTMLEPDEDGVVTRDELHRAYKIEALKADLKTYMTVPVMTAKLSIIAQSRDDVALTADARILGWSFKGAEAKAVEAAE